MTEGIAFAPETARTGLGGPIEAPRSTTSADSEPVGAPVAGGEASRATEEAPAKESSEKLEEATEGKPEETSSESATTESSESSGGDSEEAPVKEASAEEEPKNKASAELWADVMANSEGVPPEVLSWLKEPDRIRSDIEDSENAKKYTEWWEKQGESTKQAVGRVVNLIFKTNRESLFNGGDVISDFGDSFMNWMRQNHGGYVA